MTIADEERERNGVINRRSKSIILVNLQHKLEY